MKQLTFKDLIDFVDKNKSKIPLDTKVFIGSDEEYNMINCAFYIGNETKKDLDILEATKKSDVKFDNNNNIIIAP